MAKTCNHLDQIGTTAAKTPNGCEECLATGQKWVQLRLCLSCGHVGCCDSSPGKHATAHYKQTQHAVMREHPGATWGWCYADELKLPAQTVNR
ncbi:MAG: UBP-type zinc finger domain-containing protein [Myxococcales bacterium]